MYRQRNIDILNKFIYTIWNDDVSVSILCAGQNTIDIIIRIEFFFPNFDKISKVKLHFFFHFNSINKTNQIPQFKWNDDLTFLI